MVNVCVLTESRKRINDEIEVEFNRNIVKVGVFESDFGWSPFPFSPSELFVLESNQDVREVDENASNTDDNILEDGEIKDVSDDGDEGISETILPNETEKKMDAAGTGGDPAIGVAPCTVAIEDGSGEVQQ